MRIAWFTPFSPRSAIGHYSDIITGLLADRHEVVVYASESGRLGPRPCRLPVRRLPPSPDDALLTDLESFDLFVYNMGNHFQFHRAIYNLAVLRPGVVILHDLVLRDFFSAYYIDEPERLADSLVYAHGAEAKGQAHDIRQGEHEERLEDPARLALPLFRPALHRARGVVVHSEYAAGRVRSVCPAPLTAIDFPFPFPADSPSRPSQDRSGRVKVLTFGVLNANKLVHVTLHAIATSPLLRQSVEFTVVGDGPAHYVKELRRQIRDEGLDDCVRLEGYQPDEVLAEHLSQADVVVNLRNPHLGESSWSLVEALGSGAAAVVWGHGFYDEFPDTVLCKVHSEAELLPTLERLVARPQYRVELGRRAREHVRSRFHPNNYLERFLAFVDTVRSYHPVLALVDRVSDVLLELGSGAQDDLREDLEAAISSLLPRDTPATGAVWSCKRAA